MKNQKTLCTQCQTELKQLKHSILCGCGIKLKTIPTKYTA